jgi:AraC-like DNA-binding protein
MRRRGMDVSGVLLAADADNGFIEDLDRPLPAYTVHRVAAAIAALHGETHYFSELGSRIPRESWPPGIKLDARGPTLGAYLLSLCVATARLGTAQDLSLTVSHGAAQLEQEREDDPHWDTPHIDAFLATFVLVQIQKSLGLDIHPREMTIHLSDPKLLVPHWRALGALPSKDFGIRFPADWLMLPLERLSGEPPAIVKLRRGLEIDLPMIVRNCLTMSIPLGEITPGDAARLCGYAVRELNGRLRRYGTSIADVIDRTKCDHARRAVLDNDKSLSVTAADLGYASIATFSRSFKRWMGSSPREFRRLETHRLAEDALRAGVPVETAS